METHHLPLDRSPSSNVAKTPSTGAPSPASINDTYLRRLLVLLAVRLLRLSQKRSVLRLYPWLCIKYGESRELSEARTLQFVRQHTSIPTPKVYCAFERKGITYIVMKKLRGRSLAVSWKDLSDSSRGKILHRLRELVLEMRSVPAPGNEIAGVDGGTLWDCRLPCGLERFGPFADNDDFHRFLRNGVDEAPPGYPDITEMIQLQKQEWGSPVLTHGDLSSLNIMVHKGDITGIIDWETSGWWPPYWEYTTAHQVNPRNMFWAEHIDQFLDPWPEALKMEKIRQRWWGDF
ncbi:hypothetical protein H2204_005068 [Knufia peltigerae]|uniref:Aminoglycoside phosphotransferase domain-containing protein n=1 Tax=Knufia peltigerae TaxID=1002370 RepID=A0AA39CYT6_9EURO|nr:hypothetical protein H2204_005068 [Knufia peltigerae]